MVSIRTLEALRDYGKKLAAERGLPSHVRHGLMHGIRAHAAVLLQNIDPRKSDEAYRIHNEIESL